MLAPSAKRREVPGESQEGCWDHPQDSPCRAAVDQFISLTFVDVVVVICCPAAWVGRLVGVLVQPRGLCVSVFPEMLCFFAPVLLWWWWWLGLFLFCPVWWRTWDWEGRHSPSLVCFVADLKRGGGSWNVGGGHGRKFFFS